MKLRKLLNLMLLLTALIFVEGCNKEEVKNEDKKEDVKDDDKSDDEGEGKETFTISFDTKGGSTIDAISVKKDEIAPKPQAPTKNGYLFVEWLLDGNKFDFKTTPISKNISLVASWAMDGSASDWTFESLGSYGGKITKYTGAGGTAIIIPATIDGKKILEITSSGIFDETSKTQVESIDMSEAIYLERINSTPFKDCSNLTSVIFPKTLISLPNNALFENCTALISVTVSKFEGNHGGDSSTFTSIGENTLNETPFEDENTAATVKCPKGYIDTYKTAWEGKGVKATFVEAD